MYALGHRKSLGVNEFGALAADGLGDQRPPPGRVAVEQHGRVELDELDVADADAGPQRQRDPVAGGALWVGGGAVEVTEAAGWFDDLTLSPPLIVGIARTASTNEDLKERVLIHLGIMNQLSEGLDPRRSFLYHGLLAIPFVGNADWQSALERTVANWQTLDRRGINAILGSGYFGPADLKKICTRILEDWENELQQPLARWFAPPNRGGHVQRALGHPELAKLASITARQIHDRLEGGPGFGPNIRIPDFIKYTVNAILFENDFNHWTPDDHEPQGK